MMTEDQLAGIDKQRAAREKANRIETLIKASGFGLRHMEVAMAATVPRKPHDGYDRALDMVWKRAVENRNGATVCLLGPRGTGKTQMACDISMSVMRNLGVARYTTALEMFIALRATYRGEGASESSVLRKYIDPHLLTIDEVQESLDTQWESVMLTHIVDKRYADCKSTILIANLVPEEFAKRAGKSIASRVKETGCMIECAWAPFR